MKFLKLRDLCTSKYMNKCKRTFKNKFVQLQIEYYTAPLQEVLRTRRLATNCSHYLHCRSRSNKYEEILRSMRSRISKIVNNININIIWNISIF
jgi:hypothetical protein